MLKPIKSYMLSFLRDYLSNRVKKLILIASLIGLINDGNIPSGKYLVLLNTQFGLSYSNKALSFPIILCNIVWPKECKEKICLITSNKEEDYAHLAKELFDIIPIWLHYAPDTELIQDINSVLLFNSLNKSYLSA